MKKLSDKEFQEALEGKLHLPADIESDDDFKAYKLLFETLEEYPLIELSPKFSKKVVETVASKKANKPDFEFYIVIIAIVSLVFLMLFSIFKQETMVQLRSVFFQYKWILLTVTLFITSFLFFDNRLLSKQVNDSLTPSQ